MSIVATRQNVDGSFDQVGMNNRAIAPSYRQPWRLAKWARAFGNGRAVRLEHFHGYEPAPYRVEYVNA